MTGSPDRAARSATDSATDSAADGRLRIVLIEFLPRGGMFQFSFQFADALARAGHRVTLLTGPDPELTSTTPGLDVVSAFPTWNPNANTEVTGPARVIRRITRALRLVESWRRALAYLRAVRPDVAQFGELRFVLDTGALLAVARWGRVGTLVDVAHNPLPYDVHGKDQSVEKSGRLTRALLSRAYRACDLVLVLGDGPKQTLTQAFPDVARVEVCGHGDYSGVTADEGLPAPSAAPPAALFFGAWTKYKQIPLLLEAFALVRERLPEAVLTLAGPVMPDVDLPEISARADEIGHVDLRPGYVEMEDLPTLFSSHRVVMFTYQTVNISGSIHMAYTFGRPVVATDVGAMRDVVQPGVTGLLTANEAASIADAMVEILGDPDTADRMGRAAAEEGHRGASWSSVAERALAAYGRA